MLNMTLIDDAKTIAADKRHTILDNALRNGIDYPHSCRAGQCGGCKSKLIHGEITMDPHDPHALSEQEKSQGWFLACRSKAKTDISIAYAKHDNTDVKKISARVVAKSKLTYDIVQLIVEPEEAQFIFKAGQYAHIKIGNLPERPYSFANTPSHPRLEFHIRQVGGGLVSNTIANDLLIGDRVVLTGPFGNSVLQIPSHNPIIAVAGGTGLAPILSIVRTLCARGDRNAVSVYIGARDERDVYGEEELLRLAKHKNNIAVEYVLSKPTTMTHRRTGMLHQAIKQDFDDLSAYHIYAAGPPALIDTMRDAVAERGGSMDHFFADSFRFSSPTTTDQSPMNKPTRWQRWLNWGPR